MLVFKPSVGLVLRGRINQLLDSHISLLVFGLFNASILGDDMCKQYAFNESASSWESPQGDLLEGDVVDCKIVSFQHANGVLNLRCALL